MTKTSETETITYIFSILGRREALSLLVNSNLSDRDQKLIALRMVKGMTLDECADYFNMYRNSVAKWQSKVCKRLYQWICSRQKAAELINSMNMPDITYHLSENIESSLRKAELKMGSMTEQIQG